jgi:hypothetical protein
MRLPPVTPLRIRRLTCRLPLHRLAALAAVSMSNLSRAERGERKLGVDEARRVEKALKAAEKRAG